MGKFGGQINVAVVADSLEEARDILGKLATHLELTDPTQSVYESWDDPNVDCLDDEDEGPAVFVVSYTDGAETLLSARDMDMSEEEFVAYMATVTPFGCANGCTEEDCRCAMGQGYAEA